MGCAPESIPVLVEHLFRRQSGQIVATLTRIFGPQHLGLAEDVVQDTLVKALRSWPYQGVPENPSGWIMRVARNQALDVLRRERSLRGKREAIAHAFSEPAADSDGADELRDDQLRMIFACCHPAIPAESRLALTLKSLCGFGVPEIARAFLVPEPAVAQRLVRAKRLLRTGSVSLEVPSGAELARRLDSVLGVLYLLFNEGYSASQGDDIVRHELCGEAIRLALLLARHPAADLPHVHALLALMLLQAARLPARTRDGEIVLLAEQDRDRWDRQLIALGLHHLERAAAGNALSTYHLEAGIAACHALAPSYEATNWERILALYEAMLARTPSAVVRLNRAVALTMVCGPAAGLAELEQIRALPGMERYHLFHATHAEIARRLGDPATAARADACALALSGTGPEQRLLRRRIGDVVRDRGQVTGDG